MATMRAAVSPVTATVEPRTPVGDIRAALSAAATDHAVVVSSERPVGLVERRAVASAPLHSVAADLMTHRPVTVPEGADTRRARTLMALHDVDVVVVVDDDDHLVGIASRDSVIAADTVGLPQEVEREKPRQRGGRRMFRVNRYEVTVGLDRASIHDAFAGDPAVWLPEGSRRRGDTWEVELRAGPAHHAVAMSLGSAWTSGLSTWRRIRWEPVDTDGDLLPETALPVFEGELGLEPGGIERDLVLVIEGTYEPPGGLAGKIIDTVAMRAVTTITMHTLLAAISDRLHEATSPALPTS